MVRKLRSFLVLGARRIGSIWRVFLARTVNDGASIPWLTEIGHGTTIRITDGGKLNVGARSSIGERCVIVVQGGVVAIGSDGFIGHGCTIVARKSIVIGKRALIAEYVTIRDQDHHIDSALAISAAGFDASPVTLGDDVWIGAKASVIRGVTMGSHAVVGAHALVNDNVPASAVMTGVPARIVRYRKGGDGQ